MLDDVREITRTAKTADFSLPHIGITIGEFISEFFALIFETILDTSGDFNE